MSAGERVIHAKLFGIRSGHQPFPPHYAKYKVIQAKYKVIQAKYKVILAKYKVICAKYKVICAKYKVIRQSTR